MSIVNDYIIPYVFKTNEMPMRFKELLSTNLIFQNGMNVEHSLHGFRMRLGRTYLVFFILWFLILAPVSILLHAILAKIDCHALILSTVLLTGAFFISFSLFKEFLIERKVELMIKRAWKRHLALFDYETQAKDLAEFYAQAIEEEIPIGSLQQFIFDKLSKKASSKA